MTFKIKDGVRIGTKDVFDNTGKLLASEATNAITINSTTSSTSTSTGALIVKGGVGVAENLHVGGILQVDNIKVDTNTISSTNENGNIVLDPNGTGSVDVNSSKIINVTNPTADQDAATKSYVDTAVTGVSTNLSNAILTVGDGADTTTVKLSGGTLHIAKGTNAGISTDVAKNGEVVTLTVALDQGLATTSSPTFADLALNGGDLTTTSASFNLINAAATTVNFAGAATALSIGAATGTTTVNNSLTVSGNLVVNGITTTINATTITVDDKNIELGSVATPTDDTADGGGITLKGATDKTFNWVKANSAWTSSESIRLAAGKNLTLSGSTSGTVALSAPAVAGTSAIAFPAASGTVALTSDIKDGTLALEIGTAGATNTTVTVGTGTGFSANTASNSTYSIKVGPALTNLASTMTGAGTSGFLKKTGADTYTLDTNTYLTTQTVSKNIVGASGTATVNAAATNGNVYLNHLEDATVTSTHKIIGAGLTTVTSDASGNITISSSFTETDTLATVTARGNTTTANIQLNNGAAVALAGATAAKIFTNAVTPGNITANTEVTVDSFATATYRSAKYTIQLVQGTKYQQHEVRLIHDGTAAYMTEYAVLETNAENPIPVTFAASIATGTLSLKATVTDASAINNVAVIIERTLFAV